MLDLIESIKTFRSGVCAIVFIENDKPVSSGTGFLYKGKLVSNSHVFNPSGMQFSPDTIVSVRFGDTSKYQKDDFRVKYSDLELLIGSHESSNDYAVYKCPIDVSARHNFSISAEKIDEGQEVILMGYPFGAAYMTTHVGHVSALYGEGSTDYIQLDASVNSGNSGGPLIDLKSGEVIGIITRKQTGLSEEFDELLKSFDMNISALEGVKGAIAVGSVDPIAAIQSSQHQMKSISQSIKRSASTGIGYAFGCGALSKEEL